MKKNQVILTGLFLFLTSLLFCLDGTAIMTQVDKRATGDTSHALVQMDLIDKKGDVSPRTIEMYSHKNDKDLKKMVVVFHRPASVQNTRYLAVENEGRDDDKWIYLPALKRVRRIASSEGNSSFMGSDFTYNDMSDRSVEEDTHTLLREEIFGEYDCYIVQSVPKDKTDTQYSKRISYVAKNLWIPVKIELYDKAGSFEKAATMDKIDTLQGFLTPMKTTMKNVQTGTSTVLTMQKFLWNENLPGGLFTTRFLETGRP